MKGGKEHGYGTFTFADGDKYVGEYKNSKRDGNGTYTYASGSNNGDKYVGEWKNDNMDGTGTYTWAGGEKYVGPWKNDERHGYGTYTHASGTIETGEWVNGVYTNISEEEEEEIFEGDIRIRIMFGKKGKIWKLLGSGHYSYGEIIDGVQKTFVVESHPDITPTEKSLMDFENIDITVSSGLLKGEEDPVEITDAIGSAVPLPWNSNSKPILYIVIRNST